MSLTLKDMVELAGAQARSVMIDLQQDLMPTWLLIDKHERVTVIGTPWSSDRQKQLTERNMKLWMRAHDIVRYSFVVEAWQAMEPAGSDLESLPERRRPVNRPDRVEVVIACATDNAKAEWCTWKTIRSDTGRVIDLEKYNTESDAEPEGWMRDMLNF